MCNVFGLLFYLYIFIKTLLIVNDQSLSTCPLRPRLISIRCHYPNLTTTTSSVRINPRRQVNPLMLIAVDNGLSSRHRCRRLCRRLSARARPPASCTRPTHAPLCRGRDACNEHVNGNSVCPSSRQQRHLATRHCRLEGGAWQQKCATLRIFLHSRGWLLSDWLAALQTPVLLSICRLILCEHKLQTPTPTPPLLSSPNHPRFPDNTHVSDGECVALLSR